MVLYKFICDRCKQEKEHTSDITTGYGTTNEGAKHCFECCALLDKESMLIDGKITLYLAHNTDKLGGYRVTNWPGTLSFNVHLVRMGKHNIAGKIYIVYFKGPDGKTWIGRTYGDNSQLCRCKRLKRD